jgi:hypothetical protein
MGVGHFSGRLKIFLLGIVPMCRCFAVLSGVAERAVRGWGCGGVFAILAGKPPLVTPKEVTKSSHQHVQ